MSSHCAHCTPFSRIILFPMFNCFRCGRGFTFPRLWNILITSLVLHSKRFFLCSFFLFLACCCCCYGIERTRQSQWPRTLPLYALLCIIQCSWHLLISSIFSHLHKFAASSCAHSKEHTMQTSSAHAISKSEARKKTQKNEDNSEKNQTFSEISLRIVSVCVCGGSIYTSRASGAVNVDIEMV